MEALCLWSVLHGAKSRPFGETWEWSSCGASAFYMLRSRGQILLQLRGQSEPPAAGIFLFPEEKILLIVNPRVFPKLAL